MFKNKKAVACEIFSSGICNINCNYCYIPKVDAMKGIHNKILDNIDNGTYIQYLKDLYGTDLECLSFWGTEPTLTLQRIQKVLPNILEAFPKLVDFSWSSNFIAAPKVTVDFINALPKNRPFQIKFQASIDGPPEITDANRAPGATDKILNNIYKMIEMFNDIDLGKKTIIFNSKPTWDNDNLHYFAEDKSRLYKYHEFFDVAITKMDSLNKNRNFKRNFSSGFSLAVPGKYSAEDGKIFSKVIRYMNEIDAENAGGRLFKNAAHKTNTYEHRLKRIFDYNTELGSKHSMFTCSGGDSNYAVDESGHTHLCHRSLYLNNETYTDEVFSKLNLGEWDISDFDKASIDILKNKWIVPHDNQYEVDRFNFASNSYHHFLSHKLSYSYAIIKELVNVGLMDSEFDTNEDLKYIFSLFINIANSCPMEQILNTGIIHYTPTSLFKLFGNGAFQQTLLATLSDMKGVK